QALIQQFPETEWSLGGEYELTDIRRRKGEMAEAAADSEALAEKHASKPLAATFQYQAGASYLYDVKDLEAAVASFKKLQERFPDSRYATKGLKYLRELKGAEARVKRETEPIVLSWVEKTTPEALAHFSEGIGVLAKRAAEQGTVETHWTNEELSTFIRDTFPKLVPQEVQEISFGVKPQGLQAEGFVKLRKLALRFYALATPKLQDGRVWLEIRRFEIAAVPIPPFFVAELARELNRTLDPQNLPVSWESLDLEEGKIHFRGKAVRSAPTPPAEIPSAG
ncbi:MAG: tetratricopeptide repeat protein, partial [Candidatus Omnitrophota bacterium]